MAITQVKTGWQGEFRVNGRGSRKYKRVKAECERIASLLWWTIFSGGMFYDCESLKINKNKGGKSLFYSCLNALHNHGCNLPICSMHRSFFEAFNSNRGRVFAK